MINIFQNVRDGTVAQGERMGLREAGYERSRVFSTKRKIKTADGHRNQLLAEGSLLNRRDFEMP
jgi:hypothetical protein